MSAEVLREEALGSAWEAWSRRPASAPGHHGRTGPHDAPHLRPNLGRTLRGPQAAVQPADHLRQTTLCPRNARRPCEDEGVAWRSAATSASACAWPSSRLLRPGGRELHGNHQRHHGRGRARPHGGRRRAQVRTGPTTAAATSPGRPAASPGTSGWCAARPRSRAHKSNGMADAFARTLRRDYVRPRFRTPRPCCANLPSWLTALQPGSPPGLGRSTRSATGSRDGRHHYWALMRAGHRLRPRRRSRARRSRP
jgi:hypothetical protein